MIQSTSSKQLRQFGLLLSFTLLIGLGLGLPLLTAHPFLLWPWIIGGILLLISLIKPIALKYIYLPWMQIGQLLGWINTTILLSIIFFFLLTPVGIGMRLLGKDPMMRKFDKSVSTYRKKSTVYPTSHMEKPY